MKEEMVLVQAGYRKITLNNLNELICGIRYVFICKDKSVRQLMPCSDRAKWYWMLLSKGLASLGGSASRALMAQVVQGHDIDTPCFAKFSEKLDAVGSYFETSRTDRFRQVAKTPKMSLMKFVTDTKGGVENFYYTKNDFDNAHPADNTLRAVFDAERRLQELAVREAEAWHRENFAQFYSWQERAKNLTADGRREEGAFWYRESERLRVIIQNSLDSRMPVVRQPEPVMPQHIATSSLAASTLRDIRTQLYNTHLRNDLERAATQNIAHNISYLESQQAGNNNPLNFLQVPDSSPRPAVIQQASITRQSFAVAKPKDVEPQTWPKRKIVIVDEEDS